MTVDSHVFIPARKRYGLFAVATAGMMLAASAVAESTKALQTPSQAKQAGATTKRERCLLDALQVATDDTTVASVRDSCERPAPGPTGDFSAPPIERRFASEVALLVDRLGFMPHRPNYFLPAAYGQGFNTFGLNTDPTEIMFQVSLKMPFTVRSLVDNPTTPVLFFAYSGSAWWQAYNSKRSSPFREYNHSPEVFLFQPLNWHGWGWHTRAVEFGFEHHSNGRDSTTSRSWNRLFAKIDMERQSNHWLSLRTWWRIPEDAKSTPDSAQGDDNPDISRFYGNGELRFGYSSGRLNWNMMLRRSFKKGGKGAAELNLSYPTGFNPRTRWYLRLFDGYGESLIDYNRRVRRIGFGLLLNDWY